MDSFKGVVSELEGGCFRFLLDIRLYPQVAIFKTCYCFLDKCFIYLRHTNPDQIEVTVKKKNNQSLETNFSGEFLNELINQMLRIEVNQETGKIRELLVEKALFDLEATRVNYESGASNEDYHQDPRNIDEIKGI